MTLRRRATITGAVALISLSTVTLAQRPGPGWGFNRGGPIRGKVVTNQPYSGVGITTSIRTLSNGTTMNQADCVKVFRDSSGRTRQEETRQSSSCGATPQTIVITDPVAGVEYVINSQNNTYREFTFNSATGGPTRPSGNHTTRNSTAAQTTSLGTQPIPGTSLIAEGTQTVVTIPAGQVGNSQPITITSIRWYSPDLKIVIQSSRTDPRAGTTTYQLNNISTAEPAASLFQLPSGLTQQQGRSGHARRTQ
jgi:hypothetical protein